MTQPGPGEQQVQAWLEPIDAPPTIQTMKPTSAILLWRRQPASMRLEKS